MEGLIRRFLDNCCEIIPIGKTEMFEYIEKPGGLDGEVLEVSLGFGPMNYLTYTIDCYQLYLWFLGWPDRPPLMSINFLEFAMAVVHVEPRIRVINNWRYQSNEIEIPAEARPLIGKMFLGVRHKTKLWESGNRYHY